MNRLEIIKEIHQLTIGKKKREIEEFEKKIIEKQFKNSEQLFYEGWNNPENQIKGEKWSQFVRLAIKFDEIEYMFKRTLYLLQKHRLPTQSYFRAKFQNGISELPDRSSELYLLFTLSTEYFQIYNRIENRISFNRFKMTSNEIMKGKINWNRTLKKSKTDFPLQFESDSWKKQFNTSENILLIWIAIWLDIQIQNLLKIEFEEPLDDIERRKLMSITDNCKKIVKRFPFYEVVNEVMENANFDIQGNKIKLLELDVRIRMKEGLVENQAYDDFLKWIKKIRSFNFPNIRKKDRTTNFLLEAVKNVDSMYEIWIFFELLHYFSKYCNIQLILDAEPQFFQFEVGYQNLELFYNRTFEEGKEFAWAQISNPDFTVIANNEVVAVFDAKNYKDKTISEDSPITKILAYVTNLDAGYGVIFWPKKEEKESVYPQSHSNNSAKYHHDLKVSTYSLNPYKEMKNYDDIKIKFDRIFDEIKYRIKPSTKCPSCGKIAISNNEIETLFGFRKMNGISRYQSWCKDCRKRESKELDD